MKIKVKDYNVRYGIGGAKYVVNYCKFKKHKDGSDFYDIAIFKNIKKRDEFIKNLILTSDNE